MVSEFWFRKHNCQSSDPAVLLRCPIHQPSMVISLLLARWKVSLYAIMAHVDLDYHQVSAQHDHLP